MEEYRNIFCSIDQKDAATDEDLGKYGINRKTLRCSYEEEVEDIFLKPSFSVPHKVVSLRP
jgi:hypothetical protein